MENIFGATGELIRFKMGKSKRLVESLVFIDKKIKELRARQSMTRMPSITSNERESELCVFMNE